MLEKIQIPISLTGTKAIEYLEDVNYILRNCGQGEFTKESIEGSDTININYSFYASYYGNLPETLRRVKKLGDVAGARSINQVKMFLIEVLREIEAI